MAVRIRLRRIGKNPKKDPHFRISVFNETSGRDSSVIEELGFYSPLKGATKIKRERVEFWLKKGAQPSETVKHIIKKASKEVAHA
ncbi:MAG TPA: 30S ribosomal protein S16 [Patescibacteria group bacterium]|nr:30S ribosomal protein S16 [Patescibacteria group bacterium]